MTRTLDRLETVACSRCGGTGQHSYCQMYGTRCFKCGGTGKVFTKRGAEANNYLWNLRTVTVDQLAVGDTILFDNYFAGKSWMKITEIVPDHLNPGLTIIRLTNAKSPNGAAMHVGPLDRIRKAWTAEEKKVQYQQALAYQATLTLQGKPRKTRGA